MQPRPGLTTGRLGEVRNAEVQIPRKVGWDVVIDRHDLWNRLLVEWPVDMNCRRTCAVGVGAAQERQGGPNRAVQVDDDPLKAGVDVGAVGAAPVVVLPHEALRRRLRRAHPAGS